MKKGFLIYLPADNSWIGGVYYIKNIAYQVSQSKYINQEYNIYLLTNSEFIDVYHCLPDNVKILEKKKNSKWFNKILLLVRLKKLNIKYVFPYRMRHTSWLFKTIEWIPDFQDKYLPELFSDEELLKRKYSVQKKLTNQNGLILSSQDCLKDITKFYTTDTSNIYVMPFVSYIEQEIKSIKPEQEKYILSKFNLFNKKYLCVSNQFWKHKNHLVVLKAIEMYFADNPDSDVIFIFTGNLEDRRNLEYIKQLRPYFDNPQYKGKIINLGFIDRKKQLVVMKNAEFIIQPSLFEGWGTVLEDCKVLDKTVLLSNIPIHKEQKSDKCILFNPQNPLELKKIIEDELNKKHISNLEEGIADMKIRARLYIHGLEKCLGLI